MVAQVVAVPIVKYVIGTVASRIFGRGDSFRPPRPDSTFIRGAQNLGNQIRANAYAPQAGGSGPSVPDRMPTYSPPPFWAMAAPVIIFPPKKARRKRVRAKRIAAAKTQGELLMKRAAELARKNPRLAKVLTRLGRYGRFAEAGAWGVGPMIAWDVGQWIGGQIYQRGTDWYFGKSTASAPKMPKPTSIRPKQRITDLQGRTMRPGRMATMPSYDSGRVGVESPPQRQQGTPQPARRSTGTPQPARTSSGQVQKAPKLRSLPKNVMTMPKIDPRTFPKPSQLPVGRVAGVYARWQSLPEWARNAAIGGATAYVFNSATKPKSPYVRSPAAPAPYTPPETVGLTSLQSSPLPFAQTQTASDKCKCPKSKKKQSGKPKCRNPIVSRRRRTKDGRRFSTVTRELTCPA